MGTRPPLISLLLVAGLASTSACRRDTGEWRAALDDPDPLLRRLAVVALARPGRATDPALAPSLIGALLDPDPAVRAAAGEWLAGLAPADAGLLVEALLSDRPGAPVPTERLAEALRALGPEGPSALAAGLAAHPEAVRPDLLLLLGGMGRSAVAPLLGWLADGEASLRAAAATALGRTAGDDPMARAGLLEALQRDGAPAVRRAASAALAPLVSLPDVAAGLLRAGRDPDKSVRRGALDLLVPALLGALDGRASPEASAARAALDGLGPGAVTAAARLARGDDAAAEARARRWLASRGTEALPAVLAAFPARRVAVEGERLRALVGDLGPGVVPAALAMVRDANSAWRVQAAGALALADPADAAVRTTLLALLTARDELLALSAAGSLAALAPDDDGVQQALMRLGREGPVLIRGPALGHALDALLHGLDAEDPARRAASADRIVGLGGPAVSRLARELEDGPPGRAVLLCGLLARLGPEAGAARPALSTLARGDAAGEELAGAARAALAAIGER